MTITFWMVQALLAKITYPFIDGIKYFLLQFELIQMAVWNENSFFFHIAAQVVILFALIALATILGFFAKNWLVKSCISLIERALLQLPFLNMIYLPLKKTFKLLLHPHRKLFEKVQIIPFPTISKSPALKLGVKELSSVQQALQFPIDTFLLPTAPNPLMGFLFFKKKGSAMHSNMSVEEAMKYMISLGLLEPEHL